MEWRAALVLGLLGLAAGAPLQADSLAARTLIHDCTQRADPSVRGIEALRTDCPAVGAALEGLGIAALLPKDWRARLTPRALEDLNALSDRYAQPVPSMLPNVSSLQAIARHLEAPPTSDTWWGRLRSWLASWLGSDRNRWPDWLRSLPYWRLAARILLYGAIALVLIAAATVVAMELRSAGVFEPGRRRTSPSGRPASDARPTARPSTISADIDAVAEQARPEALLRLLVAALIRSHRLERDGVLTCRELITAARFDTKAQREVFTNVALLAEQVLYGDPLRAGASLTDELLGAARGLYAQLAAVPAEQPSR
jgi:hypothetical protein